MRKRLFLLVFVCLFIALPAYSQRVIENESTASIAGNEVVIQLAIENNSPIRSLVAKVELIDIAGATRAIRTNQNVSLRGGKQSIEIHLPLGDLTQRANEDLAWYRLRYSVGNAGGIIAMSQLVRDLFELRIIAADNLMTGTVYRTRIRAVNPFTDAPAIGVAIETHVELDLRGDDDKKLVLTGAGVTDTEGFAVIDFTIPADIRLSDEGEIKVTGRKGGLVREAKEDLNALKDDVQILAMTDKPIYQPGQMLNLRGIVLKGGDGKTVVPGSEVEFRIQDEDDTLLYRERVTSSAYGIAAIAWRIPVNAKLGNYSIRMRDADGEQIGWQNIKVSRYDLPNFAVRAKLSKPYYLPADKEAEVEVRADYLFGKPVTKGKVRVVQEKSREWNWKEQKYDINEGAVREGETGVDGKYTAKFDLSETHDDLKDDDDERYEDLKFAAYFTDLTTNKTEQRRFDVRVTREPIQVYLIRGRDFGNSNLPMTGYVSSFYADGTPAECNIEIKASEDDEDKFKTIGRIKTNSYGAGKFTMPRPNIGDPDDDLDFRIIAKDKDGRRGIFEDNVYFGEREGIAVTTDRTIYKPGETMSLKIASTKETGTVYVDVVRGWSVVDSRFVNLKDGKAELNIPYSDQFAGELKIAAFMEDPDDDDDLLEAAHGVIFPAKQGINVDASFDKAVYKPNDEATVKFGILDIAGRAIESALGVVVFDKAVEERARTDSDFGGMFRGLGSWLGYGDGFGGVNVKDLNELDLSKPISDEMQLVGEIILHDHSYIPNIFRSKRYRDEAKTVYSATIANQMNPVATSLMNAYTTQNYLHPVNDASLRNILGSYNIDFDEITDPWGVAYKAAFTVDKTKDVVTIISAGPDKAFDTNDDFTAFTTGFEYFTPMGKAIDTAVNNYHARTGEFVRDEKALFAELGIRELIDRFGRPYKAVFDGDGRYLRLQLWSSGEDGRFLKKGEYYGDDFSVWTSKIDFFLPVERRITLIQSALKKAPMTEADFKATLSAKGVNFDDLHDGNGNPLYVNVEQRSRYWDKVTFETVQNYGDQSHTDRRTVTPVTQNVIQFTIRGIGSDGKQGTWDDVTFTQVVHVLSEQSKDDPKPVLVMQPAAYVNNTGSIAGTVTDANGAVVPNAPITASNIVTRLTRSTKTDDEGRFLLAILPAGTYSVRASSPGFVDAVMDNIPVNVGSTATVNITLQAGSVSEVVNVAAENASIQTSSSSVGTTITSSQIESLPVNGRRASQLVMLQPGTVKVVTKSGTAADGTETEQQTSTPRLREYFPETLLWQPEVITNSDGRAEVKFRMADNITTWKMYTIASTKDGKIGFAEKEATSFQSFFVDLDPPKFLTTGDEIFLPTQVRNYTEKKQNVNVTMAAADWFSLLSDGTKQIGVDSGASENAVFGFKAVTPVKEGKQRVTAIAESDSDAIERPVTVRPDGREIVNTESRYFAGDEKIDLEFPANALPGTQTAELKIYPNLMAHVSESVEGLLHRPYGCGEQTISSTYPNLMILKFAGGTEGKPRRISETVEKKASKFLQSGYERLLGYQVAEGGFSYWGGKDAADLALTAYALRFLADASDFVAVDPEVVKRAQDWLVKQQRMDGSWNKKYYWEKIEDERRAKSTTTYIARTLAMLARKSSPPYEGGVAAASADAVVLSSGLTPSEVNAALSRALAYLKTRNAEIDDPYSLSLLGLAAFDAGDKELAQGVAQKLTTLVKFEAGGAYWNLESNTAFNGWGTAGHIETTALATQLFIKLKANNDVVGKAMIFLLKNKDRYGVWYSTQTTVNVLDAFVASIADDQAATQVLEIVLNGQPMKMIEIGPDKLDQIVVDLGGNLTPGKNRIE
ncbi:MAG TPA: MG2 domain-containing protein, partial [Pyrinomonadaceae bacterium]|nr:MG2 domain-containing protein [Pyrinomonadaceae bacterium]